MLPIGALHPAKFIVPFFLICIFLQIYRLYKVRVYHKPQPSYLGISFTKINNIDNFVKTYTYFSIWSIIVSVIVINIVLFVRLEYITISFFIVALLSAPIGITFYYKLKKS